MYKPKCHELPDNLSRTRNLPLRRATSAGYNFAVRRPLTINNTTFQSTKSNSFISGDFQHSGHSGGTLKPLRSWPKSPKSRQNPFAHLHQ